MSIVDANLMVVVPPIVTVCNLCAEAIAKLHPSTEVDQYVTLYCEHNQVSALFLPALGFWQVRAPSSLQDWVRQMTKLKQAKGLFEARIPGDAN